MSLISIKMLDANSRAAIVQWPNQRCSFFGLEIGYLKFVYWFWLSRHKFLDVFTISWYDAHHTIEVSMDPAWINQIIRGPLLPAINSATWWCRVDLPQAQLAEFWPRRPIRPSQAQASPSPHFVNVQVTARGERVGQWESWIRIINQQAIC